MAEIYGNVELLHPNVRLWLENLGPCEMCGENCVSLYSTVDGGIAAICAGRWELCALSAMTPYLANLLANGIQVGLIEGRHPMPVEKYLLPADVAQHVGFHGGTYWEAFTRARELGRQERRTIHLYLTGLTAAGIGAVAGFRDIGVEVVLFNYDAESKQYIPIPI